MLARRFLSPRTCRSCGGRYFEGGVSAAMAIVAAGGAIATGLRLYPGLPEWAPVLVAFGGAVLGAWYTHRCPPRKIEEVRSTLVTVLFLVPLVTIAVWTLMAAVASSPDR